MHGSSSAGHGHANQASLLAFLSTIPLTSTRSSSQAALNESGSTELPENQFHLYQQTRTSIMTVSLKHLLSRFRIFVSTRCRNPRLLLPPNLLGVSPLSAKRTTILSPEQVSLADPMASGTCFTVHWPLPKSAKIPSPRTFWLKSALGLLSPIPCSKPPRQAKDRFLNSRTRSSLVIAL